MNELLDRIKSHLTQAHALATDALTSLPDTDWSFPDGLTLEENRARRAAREPWFDLATSIEYDMERVEHMINPPPPPVRCHYCDQPLTPAMLERM